MKLKSLEMMGFKSFVDRIQLSFPEGITAIVGPNGCGKSNIVDSILWAVGERSAKHLRGKLMEDVIFGGTDHRKALGMAEVSLTFRNNNGHVPAQYEPYGEITVTRRLFRSGESEYLINKVPCRLRDITDLFLDSGIGVDGYSIVEQGRVEYLIKANPQERRFLIEEAAGIAKYKERKRLALMKMEATQQNLLRVQDIIAEVKRQILTLERQVKRAEEYKAIRKEIKEIELRFAIEEYEDLSEKGEAARGYLKALRDREGEIAVQAAEKEARIESMRLHGMEEEEKLRNLQQDFVERSRQIQRMESELEFFRREGETFQRQEIEWMAEVRETLGAWRMGLRERRKAIEDLGGLGQERDRTEEQLRGLEDTFQEIKGRHETSLLQSEEEKGRLVDTLTQLTSLRNRRVHLEERRDDLQKRIRANREEQEKTGQEHARLEATLSSVTREREEIRALRLALQEEKTRWEVDLETLRERFNRKQAERIDREEGLRRDRSRFLSLRELQENFEGYDKGVKSLLLKKKEDTSRWRGVLGTVADILEPEPRYEVPLEAVLGQRLQYLIVENGDVGTDALTLLKQEVLGRGSFVPKKINGNGRSHPAPQPDPSGETGGREQEKPGGPVPLLRFVNVKEEFAPLAQFLLGDVGVVEQWDEAVRWVGHSGGFETIVTREGDVLEHSGIISGGSRDQGLSLLERRREIRHLEEKIGQGERLHRALCEEEQGLHEEILRIEIQLQRQREEIQEKERDLIHQERDLEHFRKDLSQIQQQREVLVDEGKQLEEEDREIGREKEEVGSRIEGAEALRREGEGRVHTLKQRADELRAETERLGGEITQKKVDLASLEEKKRGMEHQILTLSSTQQTLKEQILRKVHGIRDGRAQRTELGQKTEQMKRFLETCLVEYDQREKATLAQRENVEVLSNQLKEAEASSRYLRHELEDVRQKIHEEDMKASEIQMKLEHLQESMRERYGTSLSLSLGAGLGAGAEVLPREEMVRRLETLKASLEGFGEVNLMALEEYQELKQRHDFLTEQQADLQQALDALKKAITRINRTTTKRFLDTFYLVNERFKEVFTRLFKGGQASLVMLDEQDPSTTGIDIVAQPPGKKLQNIDLLSGGEKALVAIALIFGLFMIKPTPFCLLDEIDAPLDDANISRFIELVQEFSKQSQFVLITHNKRTMEMAHTLYGITMEMPGCSKAVSVRLTEN